MSMFGTARIVSGAVVLAALVAGPAELPAQDAAGMSWLAWSGCWVELDAPPDTPMTCIVPGQDGAALLTVAGDGEVERRQLGGDGSERPVESGGCVGVEAAEFSADGTRVYTRSRLTCEGGTERTTRGLMAMVSPDEWVRIRALRVGDGSASWVQRYRPAPPSRVTAAGLAQELDALTRDRGMAIETARMAASARPSVDDIIEAHGRTDAEAVRAWIAEQGQPIELDADRLIRMADAGVSEAVIDVAIAVSYPERFDVARQPESRRDARLGYDHLAYVDSYRCSSRYSYYDPFFYGYRGYYDSSRCGYGYRSRGHGFGYGYGPTIVVVRPSGDRGESTVRAVKGTGYTGTGPSVGTARPATRSVGAPSRATSSPAKSSRGSKGKAKSKGGG